MGEGEDDDFAGHLELCVLSQAFWDEDSVVSVDFEGVDVLG